METELLNWKSEVKKPIKPQRKDYKEFVWKESKFDVILSLVWLFGWVYIFIWTRYLNQDQDTLAFFHPSLYNSGSVVLILAYCVKRVFFIPRWYQRKEEKYLQECREYNENTKNFISSVNVELAVWKSEKTTVFTPYLVISYDRQKDERKIYVIFQVSMENGTGLSVKVNPWK